MIKSSWKTAEFIGALSGVLSVVILWQHALHFGWSAVGEVIVHYYDWIKNFILIPVRPIVLGLIQFIGPLWQYPINLPPHWSDVFVLTTLYLGSRARSYWQAGLKSRAVFRVVLGALCALLICAFDATIPFVPTTYLSATMLWVLCGLCLFELTDACWSAIFHRKAGLTLKQDILRYLAFSAPAVLLGLLPLFLGWMVEANQSPASRLNYGLISFQVYILFLALYWILRGLHSSRDWQKGGTRLDRFLTSSNTRIGLLMGRVVLGAAFFILCDAGLNLVQS